MTTTQTIVASYDAYVVANSPGQNYADKAVLNVQQSEQRSFAYFPLGIPAGATVLSAVLKLTLHGAWSGTNSLNVKRVTQEWKEGKVTWNNQPNVNDASAVGYDITGAQGDVVLIPIPVMVQSWVNGVARYGVRFDVNASQVRSFYSSEEPQAALRPQLLVSWGTPPDPPTGLRPAGSRAVAAPKPLLLWDSDTPAETQVQVSTSADFSSPVYDSGSVANTETQWDLSATAFAALTDGQVRYWRSQITDDAGLTSDWSDIAQFAYRTQGALAITAPASNGDDVLTTTPTITHTFTGRTQQNTEYMLYESGTLIYSRDKQVDLSSSFTLPHGLIRSPDVDYEVVLRVWDTLSRETNGAATDYVEASRVFGLAFTGTVAPVENLAVTPGEGHVVVSFTRPSVPSYFALWVDDQLVLDRIDPTDVATGGPDYEIVFYRAVPQLEHNYKVLAVQDVSGTMKLSDANPSTDAEWRPTGVWVVDEVTRREMKVVGDDALETPVGEAGETFMPLGRRDPVRITDEIRGYEGTLSGVLITTPGQTAQQARDAFKAIKVGEAGSVRLIYGYRNIAVVLGEATFSLARRGEESYTVSVDFWQVADFDGGD